MKSISHSIPILQDAVKSVSQGSRSRRVLDNVNFALPRHLTTAIMGSNGCGKSMLFAVVTQFVRLDSGQLHVHLEFNDLAAFIFQDFRYQTVPWLSLSDNLKVIGNSVAESDANIVGELCKELLARVGYKLNFNQKIATLSGGECQAFVLARALALKPKIMIWDEPFNAIDINRKFPWYQEVAAFVKQNAATFCFSTHDIDEALILADCVRIFDLGMKQVDEITMDENAPRSFKSLASEAITKQSVQIRQSLKGFQTTRTSI